MKTIIFILFVWVCGLPAMAMAQSRSTVADSGSVQPAQTFTSYKRVRAKLGDTRAAAALKNFDFSKNTLVWVPTAFDNDAKIEVLDVLDAARIRRELWMGYELEAVRSGSKLEIFQKHDRPCVGGEPLTKDRQTACHAKVRASVTSARKRIVLFSTPKNGLSSVKLTRITTAARP